MAMKKIKKMLEVEEPKEQIAVETTHEEPREDALCPVGHAGDCANFLQGWNPRKNKPECANLAGVTSCPNYLKGKP